MIKLKSIATILLAGTAMLSTASTDCSDCFIPGERSEYKVSWMKIPLAWSKSEVDAVEENGRRLIRIRMTARTYKAYKHIYAVDDITEVLLDPVTALPLREEKIVNEGTIFKNHFTIFNHDRKTATFIDRISNTTNTVPIRSDTRDVLSFLYSARERNLYELANEIQELYVEGKLYELGIEIRDTDTVKLPGYGKVESIQLEPIAEFDGLFLRQGKIFFWVSKQNRRMVTLVQAKVPVGKVSIKLEKVVGPGTDFWVKRENEREALD